MLQNLGSNWRVPAILVDMVRIPLRNTPLIQAFIGLDANKEKSPETLLDRCSWAQSLTKHCSCEKPTRLL